MLGEELTASFLRVNPVKNVKSLGAGSATIPLRKDETVKTRSSPILGLPNWIEEPSFGGITVRYSVIIRGY